MTSAQEQALLKGTNCEIAFDDLTRKLYATDASHYQLLPKAVAFPRSVSQLSALIDAAVQTGLTVTPRGAGTGLTGGALGDGVVVDFSRYHRRIFDLDLDRHTVRVEAGVVLDQLNQFLRPRGFCFGPDVATSARATLGGMIANNSSGSHAPYYGTTADHLMELDIVLADGRPVTVGPSHDTLRKQRELVADLLLFHALEIAERFPPGLVKRYPGYAIHRCAGNANDLNPLLCGSEGTLAAITGAELKISRLPAQRGVALIFFDSITEAMQATAELLDLRPAAAEHLDDLLLDQTRGQLEFKAARDLLQLDAQPAPSLLVVEFFEHVEDSLAAVLRRALGRRTQVLQHPGEMNLVWGLRKAGLSLLTGRKGPAKPATAIEDAAVRPKDLPAYVSALREVLGSLRLQASFYGHAAAGLLHVRPLLNLHAAEDLTRFRKLAQEVSTLVRRFRGSLAAEHGVGIARTEFMREQVGEHLLGVMREIKKAFDPNHLFNPGKILPDGRFKIDGDLRTGGEGMTLPFEPVLAFADRDASFSANLEQCNGCGGCRKETPSMCPTFIVTREEALSTRGRANGIRWALQPANGAAEPLSSPDLAAVLDTCLGCKACIVECPSNVNLGLIKTELLHARIARHGVGVRERLVSSVDRLGQLGCLLPSLGNWLLRWPPGRRLLARLAGISPSRPLPRFTRNRFDRWFARRPSRPAGARGRVLLWDDTFVRYHEPQIGIAAVAVLEAAGFAVSLAAGRKCCGRPAFSQGHLDAVRPNAHHNVKLLSEHHPECPVIFLEPSCYSMFRQDYRELRIPGAELLAERCFLFEDFLERLLQREPDALRFRGKAGHVVIHAHCHVKALFHPAFLRALAARLPQREVELLPSACCGMAGAFGITEKNHDLSLKVADPLVHMIRSQPFGTTVVASGASCRHQLADLVPIRARHMAEVLADVLVV